MRDRTTWKKDGELGLAEQPPIAHEPQDGRDEHGREAFEVELVLDAVPKDVERILEQRHPFAAEGRSKPASRVQGPQIHTWAFVVKTGAVIGVSQLVVVQEQVPISRLVHVELDTLGARSRDPPDTRKGVLVSLLIVSCPSRDLGRHCDRPSPAGRAGAT